MSDWRSYDLIASRYDDAWGRRFAAVAERLWESVELRPGARVLDVGTGTGMVPRALGARAERLAAVVGCDLSLGMLSQAKSRMPGLHAIAGDAMRLPFRSSSFDTATASFVLSHVPDRELVLSEFLRVLKPNGTLAVTSWAADKGPHNAAWADLLAEAVSRETIVAAVSRLAPWEDFFGAAENLANALRTAGFVSIAVRPIGLEYDLSLDDFIVDREMAASSRFVRDVLGSARWPRFVADARATMRVRFGERIRFTRGVLIGVGRRA
jgi:ubiquinone/menaquinone biosynthesis C-methylase UbiE